MMKRIVTMATAAVFIAAMTSPSLAHKTNRRHSHKKPVATQSTENMEAGKAGGKSMEHQPPVESHTHKDATPTTTGAPTEAKPAMAPAHSQPSMSDKMMDKATDAVKDKATDVVKEKATDAVMGGAKSSGGSVPSMPGSNPTSAVKPLTPSVPGMPK
jgi:hypothetical protein